MVNLSISVLPLPGEFDRRWGALLAYPKFISFQVVLLELVYYQQDHQMGAQQADPTHGHIGHLRHVHVLMRMGCASELTWNHAIWSTYFFWPNKQASCVVLDPVSEHIPCKATKS